MKTLLHAVFKVVFGNVYFTTVFSNTHGRKMRFSASSQTSLPEKTISGHFVVNFLNV